MKRIMKEQVLMLHTIAINQTGGLDGVRDEAMLDSALNSSFQTFDGEALYKTIHAKASRKYDSKDVLDWIMLHTNIS